MSAVQVGSPRTSRLAIASLVLGILSFCVPVLLSVVAVGLALWALLRISNSQGELHGNGPAIAGLVAGGVSFVFVPLLAALLLPPLALAWSTQTAFGTVQAVNTVAVAIANFEASQRHFPRAGAVIATERPHLSWRVHLLPYLNQHALYKKFDLQQPWNSPANVRWVNEMPADYLVPVSSLPPSSGKTCLQLAVGIGTLFETGTPHRRAEVTDGPSNTLLLVVTDDAHAVTWTAPDDYDVGALPVGLAEVRGTTFIGMFDFSVHRVSFADFSDATWRGVSTPAGGETLFLP